jgi:hypothetical protein
MRRRSIALLVGALFATTSAARGQDSLGGSRISNAGVVRATLATDSIFVTHVHAVDTIAIGDFTSFLLANIGAPPFDDSLKFRVTSDSARVRISGRLMDFPPDSRAEIGPIFAFIDSTSQFTAEVTMPQADNGIMVFRLDRVTVGSFGIPDLLIVVAVGKYQALYPKMLTAGGREFHVAMPRDAHAVLAHNSIILIRPMP